MIIVEFEDIELDACPECRGLWFDAQELLQLFQRIGVPERLHDLEQRLERWPHVVTRRHCPRCNSRIHPVKAPSMGDELILDQCPRGHGLWFDHGELETLLKSLLGEEDDALAHVREYLGQFVAGGQPPRST
jgi:hypothetical protein